MPQGYCWVCCSICCLRAFFSGLAKIKLKSVLNDGLFLPVIGRLPEETGHFLPELTLLYLPPAFASLTNFVLVKVTGLINEQKFENKDHRK